MMEASPIDKIEKMYSHMLFLQKKKLNIKRQLEDLREPRQQLQQEYDSEESPSRIAILRYSSSWGQDFGARLRATLPRELRDMVYDHLVLLESPWVVAGIDPNGNIYPWTRVSTYDERKPARNKTASIGRLLKPGFLEDNIRCELIETFFSKNVFRGNYITGPCMIYIHESCRFPSNPLEFIRKMYFTFTSEDFEAILERRWSWTSRVGNLPSTNHFTDAVLFSRKDTMLESRLNWVKTKQGFEVEIHLSFQNQFLWHSTLVNLGSSVYRLKKQGFRVCVSARLLDDLTPTAQDFQKAGEFPGEKLYAFPGVDWTPIFEFSMEEFQRRARNKTILPDYASS
ncbi:hypothetical protein K491DRAFT_682471 [Lophiostoma macrostomum CBS 122681]|uniref:Uncharacterized protein n=1 Tax=Lophiostoma macrostomum CBS 122681 TaxID=1314788 RepID=A0A6A6STT8_9PLEO|nr:hypothetical protein K491DRAFT_682471 [Lophiostoma macrostomum CBS 122681]